LIYESNITHSNPVTREGRSSHLMKTFERNHTDFPSAPLPLCCAICQYQCCLRISNLCKDGAFDPAEAIRVYPMCVSHLSSTCTLNRSTIHYSRALRSLLEFPVRLSPCIYSFCNCTLPFPRRVFWALYAITQIQLLMLRNRKKRFGRRMGLCWCLFIQKTALNIFLIPSSISAARSTTWMSFISSMLACILPLQTKNVV